MAKKEQVRARDRDRVEVGALLDAALADGQLTADEHATRTRSAMRAKFTTDLDRLVRDLQVPGELAGAAILGGDRRSRPWWIPVAVLAAAAVLGGGVGFVARNDPAPGIAAAVEAESETEALPNLLTADGLTYFIDTYRQEFGDTVIDTATVYPDFLLVQRLVGGSARNFHFTAEGFDEVGVEVPSNADGRPIDLADIDLTTLAAVLAGAPASVRLEQGAVEHLGIGFEPIAPADAGPVIQIFVEDPAGDTGHLSVSFAGVPLEVFPAR
ncbi:DUF1707 SHOCT-like domain-containing protein [Nocardia flavorosea]|uniref:DUF1707 domain-containing protein n=1 Tax=Nocardia flavorosea TaxID=53429 RepID=A0A846YRH9_9NOCA|nr:DUF1707 domain-containing protein [Nocardia flavorosea]NKY60291.1 DUF1707 domain-containing protein [Nocardia flavorosea]